MEEEDDSDSDGGRLNSVEVFDKDSPTRQRESRPPVLTSNISSDKGEEDVDEAI